MAEGPSRDELRWHLVPLLQSAADRVGLEPLERALVLSEEGLLLDRKLVTARLLQSTTKEELIGFGLSTGAATALKMMFPLLPGNAGPSGSGGGAGLGSPAGAGAAPGLGLGSAAGADTAAAGRVDNVATAVAELKTTLVSQLKKMGAKMSSLDKYFRMLALESFRPTSVSSASTGRTYRPLALVYYGYDSDTAKVKCMVTGDEVEAKEVTAAHIYRKKGWPQFMIEALGKKVNDSCNILFMRAAAETRFDKFEFCIIPLNQVDFKIKVLRPDLLVDGREKYVGMGTGNDTKKWSDVDGQLLHLNPTGGSPARRLLAFHANLAVCYAVRQKWQLEGAVVIPTAGWKSPEIDAGSMERFFRSQVDEEGNAESSEEDTEEDSVE